MFQFIPNKTKKLNQKKFTQILKLPSTSTFYDVNIDQVIHMFNEMDHQATLSAISHFRKSNLSSVWSFFLWNYCKKFDRSKLRIR